MGVRRMGLLNRLCDVINNSAPDSSAYTFAEYFLDHYQDMENLNIFDVADDCYSSRSGVRRFAQSIGYDNFKELKEDFPTYEELKDYHFYPFENEDYDTFLCNSLQNVIENVCRRVRENPDTDRLLEYIHSSPLPMFYCCGTSQSTAQEFQRRMVFCNKIIHVSPDIDICRQQMKASEGSGLLTVITSTGNFAEQSLPELDQIEARKVLLIASDGSRFEGHFDMIYSLAPDNNVTESPNYHGSLEEIPLMSEDPRVTDVYLYGSYGVLCFLELLFYLYSHRYPVYPG